jgi:hypothetical protein
LDGKIQFDTSYDRATGWITTPEQNQKIEYDGIMEYDPITETTNLIGGDNIYQNNLTNNV